MEVKLLASYPDESIAYRASGICIGKQGSEKGMKSALSQGHESIIEHLPCTLEILGVSRALTHQLVRHRIASYSQESQRYVEYKGDSEYYFHKAMYINTCILGKKSFDCKAIIEDVEEFAVIPPIIKNSDNGVRTEAKVSPLLVYAHNMFSSFSDYLRLTEEFGILPEDSRYVFTNAFKTNIVATVNARVLLGIGNERLCEQAQWEIREAVGLMKECIKDVYPTIYEMMNPKCFKTRCKETRPCSRKILTKSEQLEEAKIRG